MGEKEEQNTKEFLDYFQGRTLEKRDRAREERKKEKNDEHDQKETNTQTNSRG